MARESMPSAWIRSSSSGIRLAPSRREYSLCVWRWTNAIRLAEDIGGRVHCQNRTAPDILRPMRGIASLFALGLMMAPFHRVPAGAALEARATLALVVLLPVSSPAVAMGMLSELGAGGPFARALLAVTVLKDVAAAILFTLLLAAGKAFASAGALNASAAGHALLSLAASLAVGALLGYGVSRYLRLLRRHTPLFLVAVALVAAEVARVAQLETILVALAAGLYLASFSPVEGERVRHELKWGWPSVYILFFVLAGAGLRLSALAELWPWVLLLVGLRATSLRYGLRWAGRHPSVTPLLAREGWLGLVPQAGSALGLVQVARRAFPEWGVSLETLALAMIGVHEVVGPICFRQALRRAGEITEDIADAEGSPGGTVVALGGRL